MLMRRPSRSRSGCARTDSFSGLGMRRSLVGYADEATLPIKIGMRKKKPSHSHETVCVVGAAGFEPATPCSQSRCASRAAPCPDYFLAEKGGFEPPVPFRVRQFSKLLVSATHPPLQMFKNDS